MQGGESLNDLEGNSREEMVLKRGKALRESSPRTERGMKNCSLEESKKLRRGDRPSRKSLKRNTPFLHRANERSRKEKGGSEMFRKVLGKTWEGKGKRTVIKKGGSEKKGEEWIRSRGKSSKLITKAKGGENMKK